MVDRIYPEVYEDIINYNTKISTSTLTKDSSYSLSSDGSKLVYSKNLDGVINHQGIFNFKKSDLWLYDSLEIKYKQLTTNECSYDPDFSTEGYKLAYIRNGSIYILALELNNEVKFKEAYLPDNPKNEFDYLIYSKPIWSLNNNYIAALAENGGTSWVEVIDVSSKARVYKSKPETYDFKWINDTELEIYNSEQWERVKFKN
jgi:Tol biopolymer transport system component